jgi:type IV pilus assembly protein PilC
MAEFAYSVINKEGNHVKGVLTAQTREDALKTLVSQGLRPITVTESTKGSGKKFSIGGKKVKLHDLVIFTRELSTMVDAGVPLTRGLETLGEQAENDFFKATIKQVTHEVEAGTALGDYPQNWQDI